MEEVRNEVIDILRKQLQLLAEKSEDENTTMEDFRWICGEMHRIGSVILNACDD